jgi:hypothetical protein
MLHSYLPLLPRALDISSQLKIGVYDCLYVALAEPEQYDSPREQPAGVSHHFAIDSLSSIRPPLP